MIRAYGWMLVVLVLSFFLAGCAPPEEDCSVRYACGCKNARRKEGIKLYLCDPQGWHEWTEQ